MTVHLFALNPIVELEKMDLMVIPSFPENEINISFRGVEKDL